MSNFWAVYPYLTPLITNPGSKGKSSEKKTPGGMCKNVANHVEVVRNTHMIHI